MPDRRKPPAAAPMPAVHKVLNNNVVVRIDGSGREQILMGRGIGFGVKPGAAIDESRVQKTFVPQPSDADRATELLSGVSFDVVEAVSEAIERAERDLGRSLAKHLSIAVIDHVQFLLTRLDQGIRMPTARMPELSVLHPLEYRAATAMVDTMSARLGVSIPQEEALFLTMHLLGATRGELDSDAARLARQVSHVAAIVEHELQLSLDPWSLDAARFLVHVKFLLQRLAGAAMLTSGDASFYEFAKRSYDRSHRVAERVRDYVMAATNDRLTDEEMLYLTIHVERLAGSRRTG